MDRDRFKLIHSELIMQVQTIENDLKLIYASMKKGNIDDNYAKLDKMNLGRITDELYALDTSDGHPELSERDYELIDDIREIRNYWCHQCYLDYVYIKDDMERERAFQNVANRLHYDEQRTWDLHEKMEKLKIKLYKKYRG